MWNLWVDFGDWFWVQGGRPDICKSHYQFFKVHIWIGNRIESTYGYTFHVACYAFFGLTWNWFNLMVWIYKTDSFENFGMRCKCANILWAFECSFKCAIFDLVLQCVTKQQNNENRLNNGRRAFVPNRNCILAFVDAIHQFIQSFVIVNLCKAVILAPGCSPLL